MSMTTLRNIAVLRNTNVSVSYIQTYRYIHTYMYIAKYTRSQKPSIQSKVLIKPYSYSSALACSSSQSSVRYKPSLS